MKSRAEGRGVTILRIVLVNIVRQLKCKTVHILTMIIKFIINLHYSCVPSLQCFDTVGRQEEHLACKMLDVGL